MTTDDLNVDPNKPLDSLVANLIDGRDDGFALTVAKTLEIGGTPAIAFQIREDQPFHDEWEPPAARQAHVLHDAAGFAAFAEKYGDHEDSLIVYNDQTITLYTDNTIEKGDREVVTCRLKVSDEWAAWESMQQRPVDHRTLLSHMIRCSHTLDDINVINSMRQLKATATVDIESDIQLEANTSGVKFRSAAGEGLAKFPRSLALHVPVLDVDATEEDKWAKVTLMLETILPTEPNKPVMFSLIGPKWANTRRIRTEVVIEQIRATLSGWCMVRGDPRVESWRGPAPK